MIALIVAGYAAGIICYGNAYVAAWRADWRLAAFLVASGFASHCAGEWARQRWELGR